MKIKDRQTFRLMQAAFFNEMAKYPNDTDKLEQCMVVFEQFIDSIVDRELLEVIRANATLQSAGEVKGRPKNPFDVN